jgi:hypothetical protein
MSLAKNYHFSCVRWLLYVVCETISIKPKYFRSSAGLARSTALTKETHALVMATPPTRHGCMIYIRIRICVRAYGAPYTHLRRQRHYKWHRPVALSVQEAHISALTIAHPFVDRSSQQALVGASF